MFRRLLCDLVNQWALCARILSLHMFKPVLDQSNYGSIIIMYTCFNGSHTVAKLANGYKLFHHGY